MKKSLVIGIILIIIVIGIFFLFPSTNDSPSSLQSSNNPPTLPPSSNNEISMSSSGFSPPTLTIQSGEIVKFKAIDSSNRWPASAMHPTHTVYPNSNINKCGTTEEYTIFDSCQGISEGENYEFTFTEIGEWGYHDHLQPSKFGKIIVE
jgi:plastocyanin